MTYGYKGRKAYRITRPPSQPFTAFPLHNKLASYPPLQYKHLPHPCLTSSPHLKIPRLQLLKHLIRIIPSTYLHQPLPIRLPVPAKDVLARGRVVLIDVSVIQPHGLGGGDGGGDKGAGGERDAGVVGGGGPGYGYVDYWGFEGCYWWWGGM